MRVLGAILVQNHPIDLCPSCTAYISMIEISQSRDHDRRKACRFFYSMHRVFQLLAADAVSWVCVGEPQLRWYMVCIDWDNKFSLSWKHFSWRDFPRSIPFRNLYSTLWPLVNCHNWDGFTITYIASIGLLTQQRKNIGCCFFVEWVGWFWTALQVLCVLVRSGQEKTIIFVLKVTTVEPPRPTTCSFRLLMPSASCCTFSRS